MTETGGDGLRHMFSCTTAQSDHVNRYYCDNGENKSKLKKRYWPEQLKQEFRNKAFVCYEVSALNVWC